MHIKGKNNWIKHLDFIALNELCLVVSFFALLLYRFGNFSALGTSQWRMFLAIVILVNLSLVLLLNTYSGIFRRTHSDDALKQFALTGYTGIIAAVLFYLLRIGIFYSRIVFVGTFIAYFFISTVVVVLRKSYLISHQEVALRDRRQNLLVVSRSTDIEDTMHAIMSGDIIKYDVVGYCFTDGFDGTEYNGAPAIPLDELKDYVINHDIDDVIVTSDSHEIAPEVYKAITDNGVTVHIDIRSIIGTTADDQFIGRIGIEKTVAVGPYTYDARRMAYMWFKRFMDIILATIGCILLIPILLIVKIAYLITGDTAPIFYYQKRIGQYGKPFKLYKLRSMVPNADKVLEEMLKDEKYREEWDKYQKFENDPRITGVGKFLRKTSLDEIPQFFNVLKGDMSFVGPRPLVEGELEDHDGLTLYNKVRPGITGWWGCNGRSNIDYQERLDLEYYYVKHCSFILDVICIFRTIKAVFMREGAK